MIRHCHTFTAIQLRSQFSMHHANVVQDQATACISPTEVLDVSSGQLAKVAYLTSTPDTGLRRVAGLYITSDPWSRMTCVVAETPKNAWTTWTGSYQNWYIGFYLYFYTKVCRISPQQTMHIVARHERASDAWNLAVALDFISTRFQ
jgi:hypothetical protein